MTEPTPAQQAAAFAAHMGGSYGNPETDIPDVDADTNDTDKE